MQFSEPESKMGACPICGAPVPIRSTRGAANYCSRSCKSMRRYGKRYEGTAAGPADKPDLETKTRL